MSRLFVLAGVLAAVGLTAAAASSARTLLGTNGPDHLVGTPRADRILGRGGNDTINGRGGGDFLDGGAGRDAISAGPGNDRVSAEDDGAIDAVTCGAGRDVVNAEPQDRVARSCEAVSRQLSRDPYTNASGQHATEVEPGSYAFGSRIVAAFQAGRAFSGGASNIGYATSTDAGRSWRSGFLPGVTVFSSPGGTVDIASDPSVTYDAAHGVWLIAVLAVAPSFTAIFVSRSQDGLSWNLPVVAARASTSSLAYDKPWIACDNSTSSPFRGRCYLAYTDEFDSQLATTTSLDGGATWMASGRPPLEPGTVRRPIVGALPEPLPNGSLVVVYRAEPNMLMAARSGDGGATFAPPAVLARVRGAEVPDVRSEAIPAAAVDRSGRLYATWQDCRFRRSCTANDVVISRSLDGISWSPPTRVSPANPANADAFIPAIAANPVTGGSTARLAVVYYVEHTRACSGTACTLDAMRVSSTNAGRSWSRPSRLTARAMRISWLPDTTLGHMLGDYVSISFARNRAVPVFPIASPASGRRLRQSIYATAPPG